MKLFKAFALGAIMILGAAQLALAHFGMVIPSQSMVAEKDKADIKFNLAFAHPMEMQGMNLLKPLDFGVFADGQKTSLLATVKESKYLGHTSWQAVFTPKKPSVYSFYMIPAPYWEPAEDKFIQHLTKVVIPAFGADADWDVPVGLKTEIVPLTRPFGNYAGNVFAGQVIMDGKPVPGAEVEVEYFNSAKKFTAPNDYMVTQVVKADANGVFVYSVPWSGWWGFAALNEAKETLKQDGKDKKIELGAVLWMEFVAPKSGKK